LSDGFFLNDFLWYSNSAPRISLGCLSSVSKLTSLEQLDYISEESVLGS